MHSHERKHVDVYPERLEKQNDGDSRHQEGPCRDFSPDVEQVPAELDCEQSGGRKRRYQKQRDQNSKPRIRAIQSTQQIEPATENQNQEDLRQQRNNDTKDRHE